MFQIDNTGAISLKRKVEFIGEHDINLTVQAVDKGVNPKARSVLSERCSLLSNVSVLLKKRTC